MMHKQWIALLAIAPLLELSCTADKIAGNGSQTGNPMIAGILYQSNGKTPAKGAIVYLRKKNTLAEVPGALVKRLAADTNVTVVTDSRGAFAIDSIDTGTYVIEGTDGAQQDDPEQGYPGLKAGSLATRPWRVRVARAHRPRPPGVERRGDGQRCTENRIESPAAEEAQPVPHGDEC